MSKIDSIRKLFNSSEQYRWLFRQAKPHRLRIFVLFLFTIVSAVTGVLLTLVITGIYTKAKNELIGDVSGNIAFEIILNFALYVLLDLICIGLSSLSSIMSVNLEEKMSFSIRSGIFTKLLNSRWLDVSTYHTGDLQTRLTSDVSQVTSGAIGILMSMASLITTFITAFVTLYDQDKLLAFSIVLIVPAAALTLRFISKRLSTIHKKAQEAEGKYRAFTQESLANLAVVKSFSYQEKSNDRLRELHNERFKWAKKRNYLSVIMDSILRVSQLAVFILASGWGVYNYLAFRIDWPTIQLYTQLVGRLQQPVIAMAQVIPRLITLLASAERLMELETLPPEKVGAPPVETNGVELILDNVGFSYREGEPVLQRCDMRLRPGDVAALTGLSGVGKTTLVKLLLLLIEPDFGTMSLRADDGTVEEMSATLREQIAYVPQGNTLFSGTISDNLRIGKVDATEEEMWQALDDSNAYEFVSRLPDMLNTVVGEKGLGLSEGQAQRIAIARALIRDAPLVILDEATSALDEITECRVLERLHSRTRGTTCLVITHRSSALKYCNRRFEMSGGVLSELNPRYLKYLKLTPPNTFKY